MSAAEAGEPHFTQGRHIHDGGAHQALLVADKHANWNAVAQLLPA